MELSEAISMLLKEQGFPIDKTRLQQSISLIDPTALPADIIVTLLEILGVAGLPQVMTKPDGAYMPLLAYHAQYGWGRIVQQMATHQWLFQQSQQSLRCQGDEFNFIAKIQLSTADIEKREITFRQLLKNNLSQHKDVVFEAVLASLMINLLALASSMFSMQVYDRVIPTHSEYTLIILASGVALLILFEMFMKFARSKIMDKLVVSLDQNLSRDIFERLLKVRIDQMPGSVGSLAAQLRGYEQVRSFFTASTLFTLVDLPMSILFIVIIGVIGSPWLSLVPVFAATIGLLMGLNSRRKMDKAAAEGAAASYAKTGILVETVEGIETIKAGAGNWKFLSRWLNVINFTIENDLKIKHINDNLNYGVQTLQQISYVGLVIVGAFIVMNNEMTTGSLIACTILGGRILAPIMSIPSILVQYSHAKAAEANIEKLFTLAQDNHGVSYPLSPSKIQGNYQCENVVFKYKGNDRPAINLSKLNIRAGERVAILGAIGSGKSTLLKLLSGLYATTEGRILLDGLDINHISRESLSEQVGYLQQDHRLFQGTLRENLLIGMPTPPDDVLQTAIVRTGLIRLVSGHSSGLDLPISEGGKGLSGGQKQLVAFTRLVLTNPTIWLLDEPTASMDNNQEQQCLQVLAQELQRGGKTLIVSTHKMSLLQLVDRIIIIADNQIVMDGPKQAVLAQLQQNEEMARKQSLEKQEQKH
ncbi:bacteriocin/lantibiotic ABC transporter ATP-binding protein [Moraxella osloensis]|uniref:Bacteriocin/lantibiotic ABC transporter ATP-binding protein n=2 Tax=Bacteria TaxID=2 RepID=A0AA91FNX2_FAUOS|nr:bacteriocin/lantibiotic ABC transporter ATP-binding protein [Moraxella osloensis]